MRLISSHRGWLLCMVPTAIFCGNGCVDVCDLQWPPFLDRQCNKWRVCTRPRSPFIFFETHTFGQNEIPVYFFVLTTGIRKLKDEGNCLPCGYKCLPFFKTSHLRHVSDSFQSSSALDTEEMASVPRDVGGDHTEGMHAGSNVVDTQSAVDSSSVGSPPMSPSTRRRVAEERFDREMAGLTIRSGTQRGTVKGDSECPPHSFTTEEYPSRHQSVAPDSQFSEHPYSSPDPLKANLPPTGGLRSNIRSASAKRSTRTDVEGSGRRAASVTYETGNDDSVDRMPNSSTTRSTFSYSSFGQRHSGYGSSTAGLGGAPYTVDDDEDGAASEDDIHQSMAELADLEADDVSFVDDGPENWASAVMKAISGFAVNWLVSLYPILMLITALSEFSAFGGIYICAFLVAFLRPLVHITPVSQTLKLYPSRIVVIMGLVTSFSSLVTRSVVFLLFADSRWEADSAGTKALWLTLGVTNVRENELPKIVWPLFPSFLVLLVSLMLIAPKKNVFTDLEEELRAGGTADGNDEESSEGSSEEEQRTGATDASGARRSGKVEEEEQRRSGRRASNPEAVQHQQQTDQETFSAANVRTLNVLLQADVVLNPAVLLQLVCQAFFSGWLMSVVCCLIATIQSSYVTLPYLLVFVVHAAYGVARNPQDFTPTRRLSRTLLVIARSCVAVSILFSYATSTHCYVTSNAGMFNGPNCDYVISRIAAPGTTPENIAQFALLDLLYIVLSVYMYGHKSEDGGGTRTGGGESQTVVTPHGSHRDVPSRLSSRAERHGEITASGSEMSSAQTTPEGTGTNLAGGQADEAQPAEGAHQDKDEDERLAGASGSGQEEGGQPMAAAYRDRSHVISPTGERPSVVVTSPNGNRRQPADRTGVPAPHPSSSGTSASGINILIWLMSTIEAVIKYLTVFNKVVNAVIILAVANIFPSYFSVLWIVAWIACLLANNRGALVDVRRFVIFLCMAHIVVIFIGNFQTGDSVSADQILSVFRNLTKVSLSNHWGVVMIVAVATFNLHCNETPIWDMILTWQDTSFLAFLCGEEPRVSDPTQVGKLTRAFCAYFYLVSLVALFTTGFLEVNAIHVVYVVFFFIFVVKEGAMRKLWTPFLAFSYCVLLLLYTAAVAFPKKWNDVSVLTVIGITVPPDSRIVATMLPYYIWLLIFTTQHHVYDYTRRVGLVIEQSNPFSSLPIVETSMAVLVTMVNLAFMALLALNTAASVFGFTHYMMFSLACIIVFRTSLHTPPRWVPKFFWAAVVVLSALMVTLMTSYKLDPSSDHKYQRWLDKIGLSIGSIGLDFKAHLPMYLSLMMQITLLRIWRHRCGMDGSSKRKWGGRSTRVMARADGYETIPPYHTPPAPGTSAMPDAEDDRDRDDASSDEEHHRPRGVSNATFDVPGVGHVETPVHRSDNVDGSAGPSRTNTGARTARTRSSALILTWSRNLTKAARAIMRSWSGPVAILWLYSCALFNLSQSSITLVNAVFLVICIAATASARIREAPIFWFCVQFFSAALGALLYVFQMPQLAPPFVDTAPAEYAGVSFEVNLSIWRTHLLLVGVFFTATVHLSFLVDRSSDEDDVELNLALAQQRKSSLGGSFALVAVLTSQKLKHTLSRVHFEFAVAAAFIGALGHNGTVYSLFFICLTYIIAVGGKTSAIARPVRWNALWAVMLVVFTWQYLTLIGFPKDVCGIPHSICIETNVTEQVQPTSYYRYLEVKPTQLNVFSTALVTIAVGICRNLIQSRMEQRRLQRTRAQPTIQSMGITERLQRFRRRIDTARKSFATNLLHRLIPVPLNREDFTANRAPSIWQRMKLYAYLGGPTVVLIVAFINSTYDVGGEAGLPLHKVGSLVLCLVFFQMGDDLYWSGNNRWWWLLTYHLVVLALQMMASAPFVMCTKATCVFRYIGIASSVDVRCDIECTGLDKVASTTQFAFHVVVILLMGVQSSMFDRNEFAFVLHYLYRRDFAAADLGIRIAMFQYEQVAGGLAQKAKLMEERRLLLNEIRLGVAGGVDLAQTTRENAAALYHVRSSATLAVAGASQKATPSAIWRMSFRAHSSGPSDYHALTPGESQSPFRSLPPRPGEASATESEESPTDDETEERTPVKDQDILSDGVFSDTDRHRRGLPLLNQVVLWLEDNSAVYVYDSVRRIGSNKILRKEAVGWRRLLTALRCFVIGYTEYICYLSFIVKFVLSPSLLTAVLPVSAVLLSIPINPRPRRGYWIFAMSYVQLMIVLSAVLRVTVCRGDDKVCVSLIHGRTCDPSYYILGTLLELVIMLCILFHRQHLQGWGLWKEPTVAQVEARLKHGSFHSDTGGRMMDLQQLQDHELAGGVGGIVRSIAQYLKDAYYNVTNGDKKLGADYYSLGCSVELLSIIYIFFAYYRIMSTDGTLVDSLQHSILPGELAVIMIVLFLLIVVDRIVFLKRNLLLKAVFNFAMALFYFACFAFWFKYTSRLSKTYYSDPLKLINKNLGFAALMFVLKVVYICLGALQVKYGYPPYTKSLVVNGSYSLTEYIVYMASRIFPFLFDFRVILDWTIVKSNLKLYYWIKFEDICHELYMLRTDLRDTEVTDRVAGGPCKPYPLRYKLPQGLSLLFIITVVLMMPLLLYSSFSPVVNNNAVGSLSATLSLEGVYPLWTSNYRRGGEGGKINTTVSGLIEKTRPQLVGTGMSTQPATTVQYLPLSNFSDTVWDVSPPARERTIQLLLNKNRRITMDLTVTIRSQSMSRTFGGTSMESTMSQEYSLTDEERVSLVGIINGSHSAVSLPNLYTPFLYSKPGNDVRARDPINSNLISCFLSRTTEENVNSSYVGTTPELYTRNTMPYFSLWCYTMFNNSNPSDPDHWADLSKAEWRCNAGGRCPNYQSIGGKPPTNGQAPLYFVVQSDPVIASGLLASIGIVAAYTTFVLAIGRVLRFSLSGLAFKVTIEDLEDPSYLVNLVEYIHMARAEGDLRLENEMYHELVNTLRTSELLVMRTKKAKLD